LSNINPDTTLLGNPDCPDCKGLGYVRLDVPIGHPQFGKLQVCTCRQHAINDQYRARLFSISNLEKLHNLTFDNFEPRGRIGLLPRQADSLERAYKSCLRYSQTLKGWMFIQGGYGSGKTHLAAAIANFAIEMGVPTLFLTVPDLLDALRFSFDSDDTTYEERFDDIRNVGLLILDDFGTQNATDWAQEKLFQIINFRYINRLPLVVTANITIRDIEGRIRSRLEDPELVETVKIEASDYRKPVVDLGFHELSSLRNKTQQTFATFSLRKGEGLSSDELHSLKTAFEAAQNFARNPQGWFVLIGTYACGKTHLAAAIANYIDDFSGSQLFVSVPEFLDHLRATFSPSSLVTFDQRFIDVKSAKVLILDDLNTQSMTPWVRDKLYQLFLDRYDKQAPTVITTSDTLDLMDARIRSRLLDKKLCKIYSIIAPPFKGGKK
jgi:DNA replication protein DnaC